MTGLTPEALAMIRSRQHRRGAGAAPGITDARYRSWRPGGLSDGEIRQEAADPETSPERRRALEAEMEGRRRDRADARRLALSAAAQATERVIVSQATGGWP